MKNKTENHFNVIRKEVDGANDKTLKI